MVVIAKKIGKLMNFISVILRCRIAILESVITGFNKNYHLIFVYKTKIWFAKLITRVFIGFESEM